MTTMIYHNPKCSKSREALQILKDKGIKPKVIEYIKTPPTYTEIEYILDLLEIEPKDLMREKEKKYSELGLSKKSLSREALIQSMAENPILIERPIIIHEGKAILGRPPVNVHKLF